MERVGRVEGGAIRRLCCAIATAFAGCLLLYYLTIPLPHSELHTLEHKPLAGKSVLLLLMP